MAVVTFLVLLLALLVVEPGLVAPHSTEDVTRRGPDDVRLVNPSEESDAQLWPFTSRGRSFESLTLPINAVVRGNTARVVSQLRNQRDSQWEQLDRDWQGVDDEGEPLVVEGTDIAWGETTGATRYTYVSTPNAGGEWVTETAQLHDGTYFGSRYHLRLYEGGTDGARWTAIQAHHEHWDWFRLRHTVGSLATAQHHLETEYFGTAYTADVSRERFANGGISDADGWVSVVDLRSLASANIVWGALLLSGFAEARNTSQTAIDQLTVWLSDGLGQRSALLFACLLSLPLLVRTLSITGETAVPGLPVKLVAGTLYLCLAVGIPAAALTFPLSGEPFDWAGIAILGLGLGFILDYQSIGIDVLPIAVVLHRLAVLGIVGLIAASASYRTPEERWNRPLKIGLVLWACVLAWPLFIGL
ncbi:hypothetical protein SAMN04487950_1661 [Halogranum rubrum]|uniref:Uncharacterized protein n=1 Tax=Halogranum rubrum TaxID=553466 RepID=A0A1I4D7P6_9EURY|nr:hypothetical protein [Halogranum rubrum]SFK88869.1 hypothetical protein SAMN04487950_1661 [Halogranum rubrum]